LSPAARSPLGRFVAALLLCAPRSLGAAIYSYRRHIRSIISKGVSTAPQPRRAEEAGGGGGGGGGWRRRLFRGWKNISQAAFASPPTSDFSHSSLPLLLFTLSPAGTFSEPMLALFLTLFHPEKLSSRPRSRARACARVCERRRNNGTELASNR